MKRIIAMMLALMMVFALCACGNNTSNDDKQKADDSVKTLTVGVDPPTLTWAMTASTPASTLK